jgi:hypothetical protein
MACVCMGISALVRMLEFYRITPHRGKVHHSIAQYSIAMKRIHVLIALRLELK